MCGENPVWEIIIGSLAGSPPRVRGKQKYCAAIEESFRITPACAGKTLAFCTMGKTERDHPRVCGENTFFFEDLNLS